ncbi:unnamed protein product [Arabidopsis arenosa]|uniref:Uncharacterized protein n=1 Tax=Arabidopsis arenosa TaxID=38785 RepID=A0A8S2B381_ARAAE|nr:unnamed protein product [Arabidopsis arenosa]
MTTQMVSSHRLLTLMMVFVLLLIPMISGGQITDKCTEGCLNPTSCNIHCLRRGLGHCEKARGSASGGREEGRAPSTAEEFTRQGVASQTVEKSFDGAAVAVNVSGDSEADVEKVKEAFKDKKDYNYKKGNDDDDNDGLPINTAKGI